MDKRIMAMIVIVLSAMLSAGHAAAEVRDNSKERHCFGDMRNHCLYFGFGFGPTQLSTSSDQREVSGIDFTFNADANDLGGILYAGYWITDHVGLEIGWRDYGAVDASFAFNDPSDNSSGTGESEISTDGSNVSLIFGFDIGKNIQLTARVGMLSWNENFKTRFDVQGQPSLNRELELSGIDPIFGLGMSYRLTPHWRIEARYEDTSFDKDRIKLFTVGLSFEIFTRSYLTQLECIGMANGEKLGQREI